MVHVVAGVCDVEFASALRRRRSFELLCPVDALTPCATVDVLLDAPGMPRCELDPLAGCSIDPASDGAGFGMYGNRPSDEEL